MRRSSALGFGFLVVASALLFVPLATAGNHFGNASQAVQTLTVVALFGGVLVETAAWWVFGQRSEYAREEAPDIPASYLGLAALLGALAATVVGLPPVTGEDRAIVVRTLFVAACDGVGLWLLLLGTRRIFPRETRGFALFAIVLILVTLFPGPTLLLQPKVEGLGLLDPGPQLRAGFRYWTTGAALLVAPLLALTAIPGDWFERWWNAAAVRVMAIPGRVFVGGLLLLTFAIALFFAFYSFGGRPTSADEVAQLWHAQMLLGGRLSLPPDPNAEFFAIDNVIDGPRWMSQFPIGGPAVLALGLLLHAPWLLNPAFTALTALNVYRFVQRAYGESQARAAAVVFVSSPMVMLMGGTYMNHTPTAWLVTLALAAAALWTTATDPATLRRSAAIVGISIGAAITIRPLDGVVAGSIIGLLMLADAARTSDRTRARSLLVAAAVGLVPVALLLIANWRMTGSPLRFGYEVLWGPNHSLGLHDDPTGNPHTPWRAFVLGVKYAMQLNWIATAWPVPVVAIVAGGLMLARRRHRWDVLLLAFLSAQLVSYAFYWHDGQFIGPRFMFTAVPALLILAARAPFSASERLEGAWRRVALVVIPVCIAVAWFRSMPPFGVQAIAKEFRGSRSRLKLDAPAEVRSGTLRNALIFVQEGAATRLGHRLWGVGISRPDAARLLADADHCTLLEAVRAEEQRAPADTVGRLARIERSIKPFRRTRATPRVSDPNFHVNDSWSMNAPCVAEVAHDLRLLNTVAYGPMLLLNQFDAEGHIGGSVVYVLDLTERNEMLRSRFGDRTWYRYEAARSRPGILPVLVPYDLTR